jgi:hypothetical protein
MRVSSLSNDQVIHLISRYFIPVWYSRDSYQLGDHNRAEQSEVSLIDRSAGGKGGRVCVFLLDPDGSLLATQLVQQASKPENLIPLLRRVIEEQKVSARDPAAVRASAAGTRTMPRPKEKDGLMLRVWTRFDGNRAGYGLSQDWVELSAGDADAFAPSSAMQAGATWEVPDPVADKIFRYFYPPGPNWNAQGSEVVSRTLTATTTSLTAEELQVRLRGALTLKFSFGNAADTPGKLTANVVGVVRYDRKKRTIASLEMITNDAKYIWQYQGRSQPERMTAAVQLQRADDQK